MRDTDISGFVDGVFFIEQKFVLTGNGEHGI